MNILVTGRGTSGSWKVRGVQLGKALGARVKPKADESDIYWADAVVLVKRPLHDFMHALKQSGKPWFWDVVDFYPQPAATGWSKKYAISWVQKQIKTYKPTGVIWPNEKMALDCSNSENDIVLYHHHRPNIQLNKIREKVSVVGYEGSEKYLGYWKSKIIKQCEIRNWNFVINQGTHVDWDICIALRSSEHSGYVQKNWKSNVKLANAQGSGTPFIGAFESGYIETASESEIYCGNFSDLEAAFSMLEDYQMRKYISESLRSKAYSVADAAADMQVYLKAFL